jgi:hypothetical protein
MWDLPLITVQNLSLISQIRLFHIAGKSVPRPNCLSAKFSRVQKVCTHVFKANLREVKRLLNEKWRSSNPNKSSGYFS